MCSIFPTCSFIQTLDIRATEYLYVRVHTHTSVCAHRRCRRAHRPRRIKHRPSASAAVRAADLSGAYREQRGDRRSVPRADVRFERRRIVERLRADSHAVHADGKCSHVRRGCMCAKPHIHARAHTHGRTRWCIRGVGTHRRYAHLLIYVAMRMDIYS